MRELRTDEVCHLDAAPLALDEQVLAGGERLQAFLETRDEILAVGRGRLRGDGLNETQQVFGTVVDLSEQGSICSSCFLRSVMSRTMLEAPLTWPSGSRMGEIVTDTSIARPFLWSRTVS